MQNHVALYTSALLRRSQFAFLESAIVDRAVERAIPLALHRFSVSTAVSHTALQSFPGDRQATPSPRGVEDLRCPSDTCRRCWLLLDCPH